MPKKNALKVVGYIGRPPVGAKTERQRAAVARLRNKLQRKQMMQIYTEFRTAYAEKLKAHAMKDA